MLIRWRGKRGLRSLVGSVLVAGLVLAQGLQAAALRDCPHHGGDRAPHSDATPGSSVAAHGPGHDAESSSPDSRSPSHDHGPCDCLGPCGVSAALEAPSAPAESDFAQVAPRRLVEEAAGQRTPALRVLPFALPYPNAPPA